MTLRMRASLRTPYADKGERSWERAANAAGLLPRCDLLGIGKPMASLSALHLMSTSASPWPLSAC